MSLKLIIGRGGSGKTTWLLNEMESDENALYIVPEQFTFSAEKKLINKFGVSGLGNPQALSFMRLSDIVFARYGAPEFISDNASFEMLVSYCANSLNPDRLKLFDGLVKKSELAQTASSLITSFKRYAVSPEMLKFAIDNVDDELLRKKLSDSLTVYREYLSELKTSGIKDRNDAISVLSDILADDDCDFLDNKNIYIDQFSDFDPNECECLKLFMQKAQRVCISLCTDDEMQFDTVNRTLSKIMEIAKKAGTVVEPTEYLKESMLDAKPMIKHLERFYFTDDTIPFCGSDGSISILCSQTKSAEIHMVGKEIIKLVRDEGLRFHDISVIARDAEQYKSLTERIFPLYDIPVFADRKLPLSGHSITVFIMSIFNIAVSGFSYENIFSYIKSPFSPLSSEEADELENYCLASGIRPYGWTKPFVAVKGAYNPKNDYTKNTVSEEYLEHINSLREKVYTPLAELISVLKKQLTVEERCRVLFEFFNKLNLEDNIRKSAAMLEECNENLYALQTVQVYNIFNDICSVLGNKVLTLQEFRTTVFAGLRSVEIGTIPSSNDCVTLGSIDRIKGHGAKVVFLVGVNSGVFPLSPTENGLFSDEDKIALGRLGIEMPPTLSHLAQNEQLLIYDALTCAGEKLYICYSLSDTGANALMPSEIVDRIRTLFPNASFLDDSDFETDISRRITTKKAVFESVTAKLYPYTNMGETLSDEESAAAYYFSNDDVYSPLLVQAIEMSRYTNQPSRITNYLIKKAVGEEMKTSITRLEAYNKCPFSFFAKYILKLEPKQLFEVSASDSGSFLHDFLDRFSNLISDSTDSDGNKLTWKTIDNDFIKINTPVILQEVLGYVNDRMLAVPRIKALFNRLCRSAENAAFSVKRHISKGDFIPMGYEISFDDNGNFKPIKITLDDGLSVTLRGRIDRADELIHENGKFVRIIDYKSSEKKLSLADVYNGIQLQLFVYLSNLCENGYKPAGILYCNLSDPIVEVSPTADSEEIEKKRFDELRMNGIVLSEYGMLEHMGGKDILKAERTATAKDFNNMFRHLKKTISETAQNIYSGLFPAKCSKETCMWCEYASLCRADLTESGNHSTLKDDEIWTLLEETNNEMD